jgi:hypothetical protein
MALPQPSDKATLTFNDGTPALEVPIYKGTVGPDVLDIRQLYAKTGKFTYDPGFMSTASCNSTITYIDGDKGELLYRGYPIDQLATKSDFMEVCHLLLFGDLPNEKQKADFVKRVTNHTMVPARRTPDGGDDGPGGRDVGVLPGLHELERSVAARGLGDPPHRQAADADRPGLQVHDRSAAGVPAQ